MEETGGNYLILRELFMVKVWVILLYKSGVLHTTLQCLVAYCACCLIV